MQYLPIKPEYDIKRIIFNIVWNIREDKHDYGYNPTRKEIYFYIRNLTKVYEKLLKWDRERKLKRILK